MSSLLFSPCLPLSISLSELQLHLSAIAEDRGEPCIRWRTQCRTHLTHHPNNGGWPWAALPINHLTFPSRHQPPFSSNLPSQATEKPQPRPPCYVGRRQSSTIPHGCRYKSDGSNYPSPSGGREQASHPPLQLQRSSTLLHSAGRRIAVHERRESYLELIASGRWGHQFHRVPRQMAHWRQVQSTNCKVLIGLQGGVDLELRLRDMRQTEWLKVCTGWSLFWMVSNFFAKLPSQTFLPF